MSHDDEHQDHTEHHGQDASEKPAGGSKTDENPEVGKGTGEGDRGLGEQTKPGGQPSEPEDSRSNPSQRHPHGQSGH